MIVIRKVREEQRKLVKIEREHNKTTSFGQDLVLSWRAHPYQRKEVWARARSVANQIDMRHRKGESGGLDRVLQLDLAINL